MDRQTDKERDILNDKYKDEQSRIEKETKRQRRTLDEGRDNHCQSQGTDKQKENIKVTKHTKRRT